MTDIGLSKDDYYEKRALTYPSEDIEANLRYRLALNWIDQVGALTVIEVGCKFGVFRNFLKNRFEEVQYYGIDIDPSTLLKIPGYNEGEFVAHDVNQSVPFKNEFADYIICLEVMEHLENATAFLKEAFRVLKPGGKLILSVPNPYCWNEIISNALKKPDTEGHIASYTYQNINALLMFSGLKLYGKMGTFFRVPFSRKLVGKPIIFRSDNMFMTRSYMYLIGN